MNNYLPTIGMEVHCELKTNSKMFSASLNGYGENANTNINVIDLGYPGTLPKLNRMGIEFALKAALALNCKINKEMHFDRKNYFYPDLPKGYQITQNLTPIGYDGYIEIDLDGTKKKIGIERVHIEEDTCKSIHDQNYTYLDFNRAGVPLIEIVTKPDITNDKEACLYLTKLREILLYLGVSDVKMEEGSMRCEANVSVRKSISDPLGTKIEIKNIGSISAVGSAINYEIERQSSLLEEGKTLKEETRRFDELTKTTILMRTKETGNEYRYFPEPDIPFYHLTDDYIKKIKEELPLLPEQLLDIYRSKNINESNIKIILGNMELSSYFNKLLDTDIDLSVASNLLTGDILGYLNKNNIKLVDVKMDEDNFKNLVTKVSKKEISSKVCKEILPIMLETNENIDEIIKKQGLTEITDENVLRDLINNLINQNESVIADFKDGKDRPIKFLMGLVMKESKGKANPPVANKILIEELKKR